MNRRIDIIFSLYTIEIKKGGEKMVGFKIGKITHYYDKIGVAVVELEEDLRVGDKIKISDEEKEFIQQVVSMQIEHQQVSEAHKGETIGLKVDQPVKKNSLVYKIS